MSTVWAVIGTSGEYSDQCFWVSSVHATQVEAEARCTELMALIRLTLVVTERRNKQAGEWEQATEQVRRLDPKVRGDWLDRLEYTVDECAYGV